MMKIKKGIPLIDQHDKNYMYGGKFGGNFIPETLKKPIDDLTKLFSKLRKDKRFLKILGTGELKAKNPIECVKVTKSAEDKIKKLGIELKINQGK